MSTPLPTPPVSTPSLGCRLPPKPPPICSSTTGTATSVIIIIIITSSSTSTSTTNTPSLSAPHSLPVDHFPPRFFLVFSLSDALSDE